MQDHALTKKPRLPSLALAGLAKELCEICRRASERRRLSELSSFERRDIGIHLVRNELTKWPWED